MDQAVLEPMQRFPRALARAQNSVRFAYFSAGTAEQMGCDEGEVQRLREGFLRAALAEFVSMEDVLKLDLHDHGISVSPLRLNGTSKPILHCFRELRNHEIHLRQSSLSVTEKDCLWGNIAHPAQARPIRIAIWTIQGVTSASFSQLMNAKNYTLHEISGLVNWLNAAQSEWGLQDLLLHAIEEYCRELLRKHLQP